VRAKTGRTSAGTDEHDRSVVIRTVVFGLTLAPSPVAKSTLVNEGEGVLFVCHTALDAKSGRRSGYRSTPSNMYLAMRCPEGRVFKAREREACFREGLPVRILPVGAPAFGEYFSDTTDLCADPFKLLFDVFITAVDVVHAIDDGLTISDQSGQHQ
jgi:hypothetical protein